MLKLTFHGTRGMIEESSRIRKLHTCISITDGKTTLCLDCGDEVNYPYVEHADALILSHLHPDHTLGLKNKTVSIPTYIGSFSQAKPSYLKHTIFKEIHVVEHEVKIKSFLVRFIPSYHSSRCPFCAIFFPQYELWMSTDIISPVGGWKKFQDSIRFYVGDCSSPITPIIRRDKKTGTVFGHASARMQLKALNPGTQTILTHHGRQTIGLSKKEVLKKVNLPDRKIFVAQDGSVFTLQHREGIECRTKS